MRTSALDSKPQVNSTDGILGTYRVETHRQNASRTARSLGAPSGSQPETRACSADRVGASPGADQNRAANQFGMPQRQLLRDHTAPGLADDIGGRDLKRPQRRAGPPNEWSLTNYGGPMDTQWCDDFHDKLEAACRREPNMGQLKAALLTTHTFCDEWFKATNYPESHDEVGNEPDRIANLAGFGQGRRMSKVAGAATLLSRGISMFFMGAEAGEWRQFRIGDEEPLDLDSYLREPTSRVREWWRTLCLLRHSDNLRGPAPLTVHFARDQILAFSRGLVADFFVVLNFGGWAGKRPLTELNLPDGLYQERLNSTWPEFAVEQEDIHENGGWDARLHREDWLEVPDYGVVVLRRV